jgi:hypothetical protein
MVKMGIVSNLLWGDNSNKTSYKDAAYNKYYSDISRDTYDLAYGDMKDYLDQNYEGGANRHKIETLTGLEKNAKNSLGNYNATKNNYLGNGVIGSLLNPILQTGSAIGDLAGLGLSGGRVNAWDANKDPIGAHRDIGSDVGALGETALTVIPMARGASLAKAGKAVKAGTATAKQAARVAASKMPKTLGQKVAAGALGGAGFGAAGSLREMGFENFDPNQFALSTAVGGAVGGGLAGLGSLWDKYTQPAPAKPSTSKELIPYTGGANVNSGEYQNALNTLKEAGLDTTNPETLSKSFKKWATKNHPDLGGSAKDFTKVNNAKISYQKLYDMAGKGGVPTTPASSVATDIPKQSFGQKLSNLKSNVANTKAGAKASKFLKTKKGKVTAGVGGGLLLSQLLRNKGNQNDLSDEELAELYNYIYGGGQ